MNSRLREPAPSRGTSLVDAENSRGEQLRELLVFLFLIAPSMVLSFFLVRQHGLSFRLLAMQTILRDLGLISLIVFFLWRNRESIESLGWKFTNAGRDVALGMLLFVPVFFATELLVQALQAAGLGAPATGIPSFLTPRSSGGFVLAGILVVVVAIAEEIIFRGYLILRLKTVTGSTAAAVILATFIFSLGHGYEGVMGLISVSFLGLIFALVYLKRQSLVAPMVMHFLQDFTGIVVIPLLRHHS